MTGFFGAVDERVWSALLVKTRESILDLRFPLYQSNQNEIPVRPFPLKIPLDWLYLKLVFGVASSRSVGRGCGLRWPGSGAVYLPDNHCRKLTNRRVYFFLQDLCNSSGLGGDFYARSKSRFLYHFSTSCEVALHSCLFRPQMRINDVAECVFFAWWLCKCWRRYISCV